MGDECPNCDEPNTSTGDIIECPNCDGLFHRGSFGCYSLVTVTEVVRDESDKYGRSKERQVETAKYLQCPHCSSHVFIESQWGKNYGPFEETTRNPEKHMKNHVGGLDSNERLDISTKESYR